MAYKPQWMDAYLIHGHNGFQGAERIPHVQIRVSGGWASVSLQNCQYIVGEECIPRNRRRDVLDWVRDNLSDLWSEWKSKSNPYGY